MAEYAVVNQAALIRTSADMPLDKGALVSCGVTTGVGAVMNCAKVHPGSSCCVIGCGGVGLNAVQGARICGARQIIAIDTSSAKLTAAKRFGATHCVNAKEVANVAKEVAKLSKGGTDYSFEVIGLAKTSEQAIDALKPGGTAVIVGVADPKDRAPLNLLKMAVTETVVRGSLMGSSVPSNFVPTLCDLYEKGDLMLDELVSKCYTIQDAHAAFSDLTSGVNLRGVFVMHDLRAKATGPSSQL
jgi:S-(hydroxymethyl)glutathione dehydrogenase/alcohol dehydrogenase